MVFAFAFVVASLSLAGAALPLCRRPSHAQLQIYLSMAAGALLGAALFHLLPESSEHIQAGFGLPAILGVVTVFLLQRYLAPHSHEPVSASGDSEPRDLQTPGDDDASRPQHAHRSTTACNNPLHAHPVIPEEAPNIAPASWVAVLALSIHSFFDGVAIAAVAGASGGSSRYAPLAVFLSVLIHKPMDGLSISMLLLNAGTRIKTLWTVQVAYALLVPVGAVTFMLTKGSLANPSDMVGYTLAFSGGIFLAIALTDLLPEIHFHRHDRHKLSAALGLGLFVMWITGALGHAEDHQHPSNHAPPRPAVEDHAHDPSDHEH